MAASFSFLTMAAAAAAAASASAASAADDAAADKSANTARLCFLLQSAHAHASTAPELSRHLVLELLRLARGANMKLPQRLHQRLCGDCGSILVPGVNAHAAVRSRPRKPAARRRRLHVQCLWCDQTQEHALPARNSARSASQAPGASARAPTARSRRGPARGAAPAAPAAAPPLAGNAAEGSASGLFGFDFVPVQ